MARLIDADELIENIKEKTCKNCTDYYEISCDRECPNGIAINYIENAPTIDTERHGHYIPNEFILSLGICSICEHPIEDGDSFCKWCGTKMDEVTGNV